MNIVAHAKNYAQGLQNEHEREIAYSGFLQGEKFMQEQMVEKACEWLKRELAEPMPEDEYQQWCNEKLDDFRKTMLNENKE